MNRAAIRAGLLLVGFKTHGSPYELSLIKLSRRQCVIFIKIYPRWFIEIATVPNLTRPKTFISATKAWRYIQTLIGD